VEKGECASASPEGVAPSGDIFCGVPAADLADRHNTALDSQCHPGESSDHSDPGHVRALDHHRVQGHASYHDRHGPSQTRVRRQLPERKTRN